MVGFLLERNRDLILLDVINTDVVCFKAYSVVRQGNA